MSTPNDALRELACEIADEFCGGSEAVADCITAKLIAARQPAPEPPGGATPSQPCERCGSKIHTTIEHDDNSVEQATPSHGARTAAEHNVQHRRTIMGELLPDELCPACQSAAAHGPRETALVEALDPEAFASHVLHHIDEMYPGMWDNASKTARTSIRNTIINRLRAALRTDAPPYERLCKGCGHSYAQHTKGLPAAQLYCRHCPCLEWVEPNTPSPAKE